MANAVVPRWHGDNYQSRFFWIHAAHLRDPQRPDVVEVTFEADGPKAFDDVVVRYDPGRPSSGEFRVTADYHQIKWHADRAGRFGFADLADPEFIGATSVSLLHRLQRAKASCADPQHAAFTLVTTDRISDGDALGELVSGDDGHVRLEKLFDGTSDRSRRGKVRKCWREHLGLQGDDELRAVLTGFHIKDGHLSLDDLRRQASLNLRLVGLIGGEQSMEFHYDEAARRLVVRGINGLTRQSFEALCQEELWISGGTPAEKTNVALRSFSRNITTADRLEAADENTLSLTELFDGRRLKPPTQWDDLRALVVGFFENVVGRGKALRLFLDAHSSLAFLAGSELGLKSGATVELFQKGRGANQVWDANDGRDGAPPDISVIERSPATELALSIALTRDSHADVLRYLEASAPDVGRLLRVTAASGPGQASVAGGAHAARIADTVADAVSRARKPGTVTHLFISAPNAFAFLLGQHSEAMGRCLPYEFDFGGRHDGSYQPTFII